MAFAVKKLGDDPILIVSLDVPLIRYLSNLRSIYAQIDQIATACCPPPLYHILDTRSLDLSFGDILLWMDEQAGAPRGSILDTRLIIILVGTHPLLPVWVRRTRHAFNVDMPIYSYLELALIDIRAQIASGGQSGPLPGNQSEYHGRDVSFH